MKISSVDVTSQANITSYGSSQKNSQVERGSVGTETKTVETGNNGIKEVRNVEGTEQSQNDDPEQDEMLQKSIEQANKTLELYNRSIQREVHQVTHTVMYTIKDTKTNEVIAEFPPKKIQDMIAKMWELAGLFVDDKA